MVAPQSEATKIHEHLISYIESGEKMDSFTLKGTISKADKISDEPLRLMLIGLAYGAAQEHEKAVIYFQEGISYGNDMVAQNFLSYLSHTGNYEQYRNEAIKLGRILNSVPITLLARNAAYSDGDSELSLFFARKALSMIGDEKERKKMEYEVNYKNEKLNKFQNITKLSTNDIKELSRRITEIAKKHNVIAFHQDYYTSQDGDAAVICDVLCTDSEVIAEMDIDVAVEFVTSEILNGKNVTAWYRGNEKQEVINTL